MRCRLKHCEPCLSMAPAYLQQNAISVCNCGSRGRITFSIVKINDPGDRSPGPFCARRFTQPSSRQHLFSNQIESLSCFQSSKNCIDDPELAEVIDLTDSNARLDRYEPNALLPSDARAAPPPLLSCYPSYIFKNDCVTDPGLSKPLCCNAFPCLLHKLHKLPIKDKTTRNRLLDFW